MLRLAGMTHGTLRRRGSISCNRYFCFGFVAVFLADFCGCSLVALGLAEPLAFVSAEAFASLTGAFALVADLAGGATGAGTATAGLLAGCATVFFGASAGVGTARAGETGGAVTTGDGCLTGAGLAALAGGCGAG